MFERTSIKIHLILPSVKVIELHELHEQILFLSLFIHPYEIY